ncbi:MAG: hypothetical protein L0Y64_22870 [Myxococcaceae bacterium]|nr:hypothetical protein [Myxococcaceae bacterium]
MDGDGDGDESATAPAPLTADTAQALLAQLQSAAPASFRLVHQVLARYQGHSHVMTGYLLGRKSGDFRVSAAAAIGPRLFDVARVNGRWSAQVHLRQLAERLDPKHLGRAVESIYFTDSTGPLEPHEGHWVSRSALPGDEDFDTVEVWRDGHTLATVRKRFFAQGRSVLDIHYGKLERVQGHWLARHVRVVDARGFELELAVTDYQPGYAVQDSQLHVGP